MRQLSVPIAIVTSITATLLFAGCNTTRIPQLQPIRFVVINNTSPSSPYEDINPQLVQTFQSINSENPVFTIHLGNIIHGGSSVMGINIIDIERQYKQFYKYSKNLYSIIFTACGPLDIFNNSSDVYTQFTQKNAWYSFNYGNHHFIVLYSDNPSILSVSLAQLKWLQEDLRNHIHSHITIFSYYLPSIHHTKQDFFYDEHKKLHQILLQYRVSAFFGVDGSTKQVTIDNIQYIPVPCDNNYTNKYKKAIRYYIVDFDGKTFTVVPRYF